MTDVLSKEKLAEILSEIVEMEPTDPRFVEMSALIIAYYESMCISLEQAEKERDAKEVARCQYSEEYGKLLENHIAQHDRLEKAERELLAALRCPQGKLALGELSVEEAADAICEGVRLGLREGLKPLREAVAIPPTKVPYDNTRDIMRHALVQIAGGESYHPRICQKTVVAVRQIARDALIAADGALPEWMKSICTGPTSDEKEAQRVVEEMLRKEGT